MNIRRARAILSGICRFVLTVFLAAWLGFTFATVVVGTEHHDVISAWIVVFWIAAGSIWVWKNPRRRRLERDFVWRPGPDGQL